MANIVKYGIPKKHGGDTQKNGEKLEARVEELAKEQPYVSEPELYHIAMTELFPEG